MQEEFEVRNRVEDGHRYLTILQRVSGKYTLQVIAPVSSPVWADIGDAIDVATRVVVRS